jgi:excisionase family DNA binding protein
MRKVTLSTKEVAALLNVTETTVKRWAEIDKIPCSKTLGGHRKFFLNEIVSFAEKHSYPITGIIPPALSKQQMENLEFSLYSKNFGMISDIFKDEALQGDREGLEKLFIYLYKNQVPFIAIIDEVLHPALARIGELWQEGIIEVNQEHRSSTAVKEALIRFGASLYHKPDNNLSALCACVEGELHDIGIITISYALEIEGWSVVNLGIDTPFDSLTSYIQKKKPRLVCLSATAPELKKNYFSQKINLISEAIHSYGGIVVCGGIYANTFSENNLGVDFIAYSVNDTIDFVKDSFKLKPGKKSFNKKQ